MYDQRLDRVDWEGKNSDKNEPKRQFPINTASKFDTCSNEKKINLGCEFSLHSKVKPEEEEKEKSENIIIENYPIAE